MPVFDPYSRRNQDSSQAESQDPIYDNIPETVRNQIVHIWNGSIGHYSPYRRPPSAIKQDNNEAWKALYDVVCREKGLLQLSNSPSNHRDDCIEYLLNQSNVDDVLDIIEISFLIILKCNEIDRHRAEMMGIKQPANDAIHELNSRFKNANIGYRFESGQIIRTDNLATHEKIVRPTLSLLTDRRFSGAAGEFSAALKHYRNGNYRDSITAANSAFESTLKTIFKIKQWDYDQGATAARLLQSARKNGLFADYMEKSFDQLIGTLKSGLTPIRNRESSSHGQGPEPKDPRDHVAEYALNLCASQILFLVKSMNEPMK